jgi:outer membrane protein
MKKTNSISILLFTLGAIALSAPAQSASLLEIYQQALQGDPQIHEAEARRLAALEAKPQARGVLLPQISATGDWSSTDTAGSSFSIINSATTSFDQQSDSTNWGFGLRQTLFRWT